MKPHLEISKQLQDLYGSNRIVIGKAGGKIYFDLPDDPEVFGELIKKMIIVLVNNHLDDHIDALSDAIQHIMTKIFGPSDDA